MNEYSNPKEDKFYQWKGVKGPERQSHGITEDQIDSLLANNLKDHTCRWTQRGNELFCTVGAYEHGMRIPFNKQLEGTGSRGEPILRDVVISA